eukprot:comp24139_c1_seq1/m.43894 comp24139_c1_seq1/g.43894  ORF comp24139_c1_seq1/g.43894 comp24139_c1_seq1/m.43894 type:complete len:824 (-) comp24139_c1_seq1:761-3232(-)
MSDNPASREPSSPGQRSAMSDAGTPRQRSDYGTPSGRGRSSQPYSDMSRNGTPRGTPRQRANINNTGTGPRFVNTPRRENPPNEGAGPVPMEEEGEQVQRAVIWGTNVEVQAVERAFRQFFETFKENEDDDQPLYKRLMDTTNQEGLPFINVDCQHISKHDDGLYNKLVQFPTEVIPIMDVAAAGLFEEWFQSEPNYLTTRPFNLKKDVAMRDLNPDDVDKLVAVRGMVIRCTPIVPDMNVAFFRCMMCKATVEVNLKRGRILEPESCENCNSKNTMEIIHNRCEFQDKQVVKLQEAPEIIPAGQTPQTVLLVCYDEFVDVVQPGDRVEVTGIYRAQTMRPNKNHRTVRAIFKTTLDVVHFRKTDRSRLARTDLREADKNAAKLVDGQPDAERAEAKAAQMRELAQSPDIYDKLVSSIAPSIWGQEDIKRGILCQLFGGSSKNFEEHGFGRFRGDINILLCGDPSTSKSQFLTMVNKLATRGIYTSGKGSSSVGLTAYVTKDPDTNELVLESGALVLSDGGVCCIDEFDKMNETTRSVLHEAMEQQTISIAKAGIICTLNARTSILAAANPVDSAWDPKRSIIDNLQMPPTLISRFDLIFLVLDKVDEDMDRRLATHIVSLYDRSYSQSNAANALSLETLMEYIAYARTHIQPVISNEAAQELVEGYTEMRRAGQRSKTITATPRQLESLIRLSEALARMRFSQVVERVDVAEAIRLVQTALQKVALDPKTGMLNMDMINTGFSTRDRKAQEQLKELLDELHAQNKKSIRLGELLKMLHDLDKQDMYRDQQDLERTLKAVRAMEGHRGMPWRLETDTIVFGRH